jgi:hypothetical protein
MYAGAESSATDLRQHRLGLGQPEGHVHGTVQDDGSSQLSAGQLHLAGFGIQPTETQVAVGLQRAHTEFFSQGEGLEVGEIEREVRSLTDVNRLFESGERPGKVALPEGQQTAPPHEATIRLGGWATASAIQTDAANAPGHSTSAVWRVADGSQVPVPAYSTLWRSSQGLLGILHTRLDVE